VKEHLAWIGGLGCEQDHPVTTLRQAKRARVYYAVCPSVSELAQPPSQEPHCVASIELEHERDVLQQQPSRLARRLL
jgi:hypothetical protein